MKLRTRHLSLLLTVTLAVKGWAQTAAPPNSAELLFAKQVWPLLQAKCLACHGEDPQKIKGELKLQSREFMLNGGASGKSAVVVGKPEESPLVLATTREDEEWSAMPPKENDRLTPRELAALRDWIKQGAPWPNETRRLEWANANVVEPAEGELVKTSGGLSPEWNSRRYLAENLWAYRPLRKPPVPGDGNPIDAFLQQRLQHIGLLAAPLADRRTLIRRATFDLHGLPPTPEQVAAFLNDPADDTAAFAALVERLLASPHYGEQWGRHWLDVVRYADSSGFSNDFTRGNAWRYRDYVIRAFNDDKPYNAFVREQIAGDELANEARYQRAERRSELHIAAGFLRMGPWELTGMEVPKLARQRFLDDVTQTVGETFLGHALQCARCHDHKFDPLPTRDYYAIQATFATTQLAERKAAFLTTENREQFEERRYLEQRQTHYFATLQRLDQLSLANARIWFGERKQDVTAFEKLVAYNAQNPDKLNRGLLYSETRKELLMQGVSENELPPQQPGYTPNDNGNLRIARKGLERLKWEFERYEPYALSVYSGRTPSLKAVYAPLRVPNDPQHEGELESTHILTGGDPFTLGDAVAPAVLSAPTLLGEMQYDSLAIPLEIVGRRQALADWIASPRNPLTARVMVNRVWLWHFGRGLAGNPNNFGATGRRPTHPELLDWLAAAFRDGDSTEQAWSLKSLHRLLMNSEAYRRSTQHAHPELLAERDPHSTSYAVFLPRRLAAEEIRDATLRVSGELNPTLGGIPIRPEMNLEAAFQPRQVMGTFAEAWQPSPKPEQRHRRSIYAMKNRGQLDPFQEVFNAPSPDLSCEAREASTVTPQVFALFNSQTTYDRSLAFAARVLKGSNSREQAVDQAFAWAYARAPSAQERTACLRHWSAMTERHRTLKLDRSPLPREIVREAEEEMSGENFQFTEPLERTVDFIPDLQPTAVSAETRGLAEVCLVLLNANEFVFVY